MFDRRFYKSRQEAISISLAEALLLKADCSQRIEQIRDRLIRNALVPEGDDPAEDPETLIADLNTALIILEDLNKRINLTLAQSQLEDGMTLADAIALRDIFTLKRDIYQALVEAASIGPNRYSSSEIKFVSTVNIASLYQQIEQIEREYRNLDTKIQQLSWNTQLIG